MTPTDSTDSPLCCLYSTPLGLPYFLALSSVFGFVPYQRQGDVHLISESPSQASAGTE